MLFCWRNLNTTTSVWQLNLLVLGLFHINSRNEAKRNCLWYSYVTTLLLLSPFNPRVFLRLDVTGHHYTFCISFFSASQWTKESESVRWDNKQPFCTVGPCWWAGSAIQNHLFTHCGRSYWWICKCCNSFMSTEIFSLDCLGYRKTPVLLAVHFGHLWVFWSLLVMLKSHCLYKFFSFSQNWRKI